MEIIADLHIHSRFSIATARDADLEHLDLWGRYKGVQVVGTGDCTHPRWLAEMAAKLEPAGAGVYTLKPGLALPLNLEGPGCAAAAPVKFVITGEVSTIYKKAGKVRKVHLLLVLPDLSAAQQLSQRLGRLGNVASDGRPILGLDARFVLDLVLEIDPQALVIPAHIWTPWFSVLGSKSGFDSLEECFESSGSPDWTASCWYPIPTPTPPRNWAGRPISFTSLRLIPIWPGPCAPGRALGAPSSSSPRKANTTWTATGIAVSGWSRMRPSAWAVFVPGAANP
jgi:DNA helicase-2/ATP-dependent DNA helicase PcrA